MGEHKTFSLYAKKAFQLLSNIPAVLWFVIFLLAIFGLISDRYFTFNNMINILQQGAVLLLVASAATIVILSEGLDLSLGGVLTLSGITTVMALNFGLPILISILVGLLTGILCGAFTGLLIAYANMPPFIASLGTQGIFYGISLSLTNSTAVFTSNEAFIFIGDKVGNIPMAAVFAGIVYILIIVIFHNTSFGRYVIAIGGNESGTRLSGVDTIFWKWMVYVFAGFITAIAGVILASRLECADPIVGVGWEFDAIAATILGGTSFQKGKGDVKGTIVGVLLITVIRNGLNVISTPSIWQPALIGTIMIVAIVFQVWLSSRKEDAE
jgi:ribose transport system permease protein